MKILVVDDSSVMRKLVTRSIRQAGYDDADIVEAEDGADAVDKVNSEGPDLVLADWNMPVMTGIEMLRKLRGDDNAVTVGFVTSESTDEIREDAAAAGASFFLSKPIDVDDLRDALARVA
ncbi:MAG: response regulator [Actinomycetota bacterium]